MNFALFFIHLGCDNAFPLQLRLEEVEEGSAEPNLEMTLHILPRIDYGVLKSALDALEIKDLPDVLPTEFDIERDAELLTTLHNALFNVRRACIYY